MKKKFSTKWKASKQPRKQRNYLANAPLHLKRKFLSINLSKELRKTHGKRSVPIRKGDTVKITKGKFKGKQGKVLEVRLKIQGIFVEGIQVTKQDKSKANVKLRPANLQIVELNSSDEKRLNKKAKKGEKKQNAS